MIKFFRKIRQKLLSENKFKKYLIYAIGEIILVVIGILIALSINNWNQKRIQKLEEQTIVKNIHIEYLQNKTRVKIKIKEAELCEAALRQLMKMIGKDEDYIKKQNVDSLLFYALDPPIFRPSENTISGLIQSGRLELLQNQELVDLIYDWGRTMKALTDRTTRFTAKLDNEIWPYLSKRYSFKDMDAYGPLNWKEKSNLKVNKLQIFKEIEFENNTDEFLYWIADNKNLLLELDLLIDKILMETQYD
ncbi:Hypothetical protein I595_1358 [Croceitalea dokdonensis DOKDO 023]|uniref:Uncharacterized protein n=1 Tax=Croceitalea dokdonensis DOKDO 023 TaxID=1300341 RepID=A0A0P7AW83_9FLAO|nr:DUF6090 family protein [Croceitalea dokdonensis]KPM32931.1 Hypothetical protein I595_1358 [Croceitalea dokdonensis DOKDO 023]